MSQTPNGGRVRRTERYAKPEDVSPQKAKRPPQPKPPIGRSAELHHVKLKSLRFYGTILYRDSVVRKDVDMDENYVSGNRCR